MTEKKARTVPNMEKKMFRVSVSKIIRSSVNESTIFQERNVLVVAIVGLSFYLEFS